jgi:TetR/AcrR family transcriptional regulator
MAAGSKARARLGTRRQPEASRGAILKAALAEFAQEGLAGARMDAIAEAAGVNKALLYYYFGDKDALYGAVLDIFFAGLLKRIMAVCDQPGTAGRRFLSYAKVHFDAIAESPYYAHIFMSEMMRASRSGSPHLDRIFPKYLLPIGTRVLVLVQEGIADGEFRHVDAVQFVPAAIGSIVHYFLTAPLRRKFQQEDPNSPGGIERRRAAVLDYIAAALFNDRAAGTRLAAEIIAGNPAAPMPSPERHSTPRRSARGRRK